MKNFQIPRKVEQLRYPLIAFTLFCYEAYLSVYVKDNFFRPFFGDFIAVIFAFTFFKCFYANNSSKDYRLAGISLMIAYLLEILQKINFLQMTGLDKYPIMSMLIGHSFSWIDLLAYTLGYITLLVIIKFK
ncbi:MAG: DUF2809 domain-containing protein [Flectobacillus sp.]|uniref:ribosomal maturation YjgA family protein n=1 Tax=Flectobacillus sp. TaxID=50419 RepID=UPI003B9CFCB4